MPDRVVLTIIDEEGAPPLYFAVVPARLIGNTQLLEDPRTAAEWLGIEPVGPALRADQLAAALAIVAGSTSSDDAANRLDQILETPEKAVEDLNPATVELARYAVQEPVVVVEQWLISLPIKDIGKSEGAVIAACAIVGMVQGISIAEAAVTGVVLVVVGPVGMAICGAVGVAVGTPAVLATRRVRKK